MALKSTPRPAAPPVAPPAPVAQPKNKELPPSQPAPVVTEPTKAVTPRKPRTSALVSLTGPSLEELEAMGPQGLEEAGREDFATPFLKIVQAINMKDVQKSAPSAQPGMFFFTATNELWDGADGVRIVPVYYRSVVNEFKPEREGFVASHPDGGPVHLSATRRGSKDVLPNGNEIELTREWYVLVETEQGWKTALMTLAKTQRKHSKNLLSFITSQRLTNSAGRPFGPAIRSWIITLRTEDESNDKNTWSVISFDSQKVSRSAEVPGLWDEATRFYDLVRAGEIKVAPPTVETTGSLPMIPSTTGAAPSQTAEETF